MLERVAAIVGREPRFDVEFGRLRRFPPTDASPDGVLWLAPDPAESFARLTEAIVAAFPAYPHYAGVHDEVIPHLTMATRDTVRFDAMADSISAHLPVRRVVAEASLLVEDPSGRWSRGERFPLG